jgi:hypothetical protein
VTAGDPDVGLKARPFRDDVVDDQGARGRLLGSAGQALGLTSLPGS